MGRSRVSCGWSAGLLLALLLASVAVGLSIRPVNAQEIVAVNAPAQARPGNSFNVEVEVRYDGPGGVELVLSIEDHGEVLGEGRSNIGDLGEEGEVISRTIVVDCNIIVPSADERAPPYTWHLVARVGSSVMGFDVEIVPTDAEPTVDAIAIRYVPHPSWDEEGNEGDPIYVGTMFMLFFDFSVSLPPSTTLRFQFQNNLGWYPSELGASSIEDGWVTAELPPLSDTESATLRASFPFYAFAPLEPIEDWTWTFRLVAEKSGEDLVQDETSSTLTVLDVEDRWAQIRDLAYPEVVAPRQTFVVVVSGAYIFPDGSAGDIQVKIAEEDGTSVTGGETHEIRDLSGRDTFRVEFSITAPDAEGEWVLAIDLGISGRADPVDRVSPIEIRVASEAADDASFCRVVGVRVNGNEPPQSVTYGESFTVDVDLSWNVPPDTDIYALLWDWDWAVAPINSDEIYDVEEEDLYTCTFEINGAAIPPRNGPWTLKVAANYYNELGGGQFTPDGYERIFQVEIVGATTGPSVGGGVDWSIGGVQVSPYEPLSGGGAVFEAMIQANPIPTELKQVQVSCTVDGIELFSDYVNYNPGTGFLTVASAPWIASLGTHQLTWVVDPEPGEYDDPNRTNNVVNIAFSVVDAYLPPEPEPGEEPPPSGENFDFYVTAVPVEQTAQSSVTYSINVDVLSGTPEPVTLGLMSVPTGASYYFEPASGTPSYSSTLTITTSTDTPAGTYPLTIQASGGGVERYLTITLIVEEGPDYSLSVSPRSARGKPGDTLEFTVSVSSDTGYSQYVNLLVSGGHSGITWNMNPTASNPNFESTLTVKLGNDVRPGVYRFAVTGSGPEAKTSTISITVEEEAAPLGTRENTINTFAGIILAVIVAAIAGGAFFAFRRFRGKGKKQGSFCIECGTAIPVGSEFCSKCGAKQDKREEK